MKKKTILALIAALFVSSFMGCGKTKPKEVKTFNDNDIIASLDDVNIDYATAFTYAKIMESEAYSFMKEFVTKTGGSPDADIWGLEMDESKTDCKTYKEQFTADTLKSFQSLLLSEKHMDDYGIAFTDEDKRKCEEVADGFLKYTEKDDVKAMHATKDSIFNVLRLMTIDSRMKSEILFQADENIDKKVNEKEIEQSSFEYVTIKKNTLDDAKKEAKDIIKKIEDGKSFSDAAHDFEEMPHSVTFTVSNPELTPDEKEIYKKTGKMRDGDVKDYVLGKKEFVVVHMTDKKNEEATENKKNEILNERKNEYYNNIVDGWIEDNTIDISMEAWDSFGVEDFVIFKKLENYESSYSTPTKGVDVEAEIN